MASYTEQQARNKLLKFFIKEDLITIELTRPVWTVDSTGGRVRAGTIELDPQEFYFIPFKRRLTTEFTHDSPSRGDNKLEYIDYILIFNGDADIKPEDEFLQVETGQLDPGRYSVQFVSPRKWDRGQAGILFRG